MSKLRTVQNWIEEHKKFVIVGVTIFVLLIGLTVGLTFSLSRLLGSVYDVDSIGANIDKIQIGDTINYTANGYSDWKVYSINKEDNTIEIVSKTSVEDVTIDGYYQYPNFLDILQSTANKYLDGKYAISARSVGERDVERLNIKDEFWINKRSDKLLFYNNGSYSVATPVPYYSNVIVPVVTINVGDSSVLNVGDVYTYSLNGIDEWVVLRINDSASIVMVPKIAPAIDFFTNDNCADLASYINAEIEKYKDDNVINVRNISTEDFENLNNFPFRFENYNTIYTGERYEFQEGEEQDEPSVFYRRYYYKSLHLNESSSCGDSGCFYDYSLDQGEAYCEVKTPTYGFVPIVTLKYSDEEKSGKDTSSDLKVGDYVKYSANAYKNWKVLNINKEKNTVDIISGGIVKNITLNGKEVAENLDAILQEEVDKYKNGDSVIGARSVEISDLDSLKTMKDVLQAEYFLNNTKQYRLDKGSVGYFGYAVAVANYDISITGIKYDWAVLEREYLKTLTEEEQKNMTHSYEGPYQYTAGLRPIITLKLSDVEKSDGKFDSNDNKLIKEQNKANQSASDTLTEEDLANAEEVEEEATNEQLEKDISKLTYVVSNLEKSLKEVKTTNDLLISFIVLVAGFSGFSFIYFIRKIK